MWWLWSIVQSEQSRSIDAKETMTEIFLFRLNDNLTEFDIHTYTYILVPEFQRWCDDTLSQIFEYQPSSLINGEDILPFRSDYWLAIRGQEDATALMLAYGESVKRISTFFFP